MSEEQTETTLKKSLLEKYEIPIDHLDFGYVKSCNHLKEIERIVKILRSHEEGFYPELLNEAEGRLRELDPGNRLLRVQGKPLTKHMLEPSHWKEVIDDIQNWSDELSKKDKALVAEKNNKVSDESLPPVRKPEKKNMDKLNDGQTKEERIKGYEYDKWDKFDAEAECLKMDIEEEKKTGGKGDTQTDQDDLEALEREAAKGARSLSKTEKEIIANSEKDLGNECYKLGDNRQAIRHYCRSIAVFPTAVLYNNRAAAYLKLENYENALSDSTVVLQMEPTNVKALYRRAQAYHGLKDYEKGLLDINQILKLDPKHSAALQLKAKLSELKSSPSSKSQSKKAKLMDEEKAGLAKRKAEEAKKKAEEAYRKRMLDEARPGPSGINTKHLKSQPSKNGQQKAVEVLDNNKKKDDKKGMKRLVVVEIERSGEEEGSSTTEVVATPVIDRRKHRGEGDSGHQVQVAHKYREKAARHEPPPGVSSADGSFQPTMTSLSRATDDPAKRPIVRVPVPTTGDLSNFTQTWDMMNREGSPLKDKAALLRTIRPHLLQAVVGSKLEEKMLTDFLMCLKDEFKPKTESSLIIEYLTAISNLERFSIICTFLPSSVKKLVIEEIMEKVNADNCLRKLYL